jgi:hypothetical protein
LLSFADVPEASLRNAALAALLHAAKLRFDFLSAAPAFLKQLLAFAGKDIDRDLSVELFVDAKKLLETYDQVADGIVEQLVQIFADADKEMLPHVADCLAEAMRFPSARAQLTMNEWTRILKGIETTKMVVRNFFKADGAVNDGLFLAKLFEMREDREVWAMAVEIAKNPKLTPHVIRLLPIRTDTRTSSAIYRSLLADPTFYPALVEIPEFYAVASYFIASGEFKQICEMLRGADVNPSLLLQSRLGEFVTRAISSNSKEEDLIDLMAAVFSISRIILVPEFERIVELFFEFLVDRNRPHLKKPAFLCLAALSVHTSTGMKYHLLTIAAAGYVNSQSDLVQRYAAMVLNDHLVRDGVDRNRCATVFLKHCTHVNEFRLAAIKAFKAASADGGLAPPLIERLSGLSEQAT